MSAKKQKLRDTTNLTPPHAISKCAVSAAACVSQHCASSSSAIDGTLQANGGASIRSLEQHFIATVHAVLYSLRQTHSLPVPWSVVAVTVASVFLPSIPRYLFAQLSHAYTVIACPSLPACLWSALQPKPMLKSARRSAVHLETRCPRNVSASKIK